MRRWRDLPLRNRMLRRTSPVAMHPMEQFEVKPLVEHPLFQIGGHDIYFTNQALLMVIVVAGASLFLTLTVSSKRLIPSRMQSMAEVSYEFVANIIHSSAGDDGLKFFRFVFTLLLCG